MTIVAVSPVFAAPMVATLHPLAALPPAWWLAALALTFCAVAVGFGAGFWCARWSDRRTFERARSSLERLVHTTLAGLDAARDLCGLIERYPPGSLTTVHREGLDERRSALFQVLSRLLKGGDSTSQAPVEVVPAPVSWTTRWLRSPLDAISNLPARAAFDANLATLLQARREGTAAASLVVVRVDKYLSLAARLGSSRSERLIRQLAGVLLPQLREEDLLCRIAPDALGLLIPEQDSAATSQQATRMRDAVRNSHFRVEETGQEVLLTASFGGTALAPADTPESLLQRVYDAVSQSQRLGRNQLHLHDGATLVHCAAG